MKPKYQPSDEDIVNVLGAPAALKAWKDRYLRLIGHYADADFELMTYKVPQPRDAWHEDIGNVLWWKFPVTEPPYAGTPLDDSFPEYMTHWTRIPEPDENYWKVCPPPGEPGT